MAPHPTKTPAGQAGRFRPAIDTLKHTAIPCETLVANEGVRCIDNVWAQGIDRQGVNHERTSSGRTPGSPTVGALEHATPILSRVQGGRALRVDRQGGNVTSTQANPG